MLKIQRLWRLGGFMPLREKIFHKADSLRRLGGFMPLREKIFHKADSLRRLGGFMAFYTVFSKNNYG